MTRLAKGMDKNIQYSPEQHFSLFNALPPTTFLPRLGRNLAVSPLPYISPFPPSIIHIFLCGSHCSPTARGPIRSEVRGVQSHRVWESGMPPHVLLPPGCVSTRFSFALSTYERTCELSYIIF